MTPKTKITDTENAALQIESVMSKLGIDVNFRTSGHGKPSYYYENNYHEQFFNGIYIRVSNHPKPSNGFRNAEDVIVIKSNEIFIDVCNQEAINQVITAINEI
jgi:hypothetical protein